MMVINLAYFIKTENYFLDIFFSDVHETFNEQCESTFFRAYITQHEINYIFYYH